MTMALPASHSVLGMEIREALYAQAKASCHATNAVHCVQESLRAVEWAVYIAVRVVVNIGFVTWIAVCVCVCVCVCERERERGGERVSACIVSTTYT